MNDGIDQRLVKLPPVPYRKDLRNMTFGKLLVLEYAGCNDGHNSIWTCYCNACGKVKNIFGNSMLTGKQKTCGCGKITHGLTRGPRNCDKPTEYKSWIHAKMRCKDKDNPAYDDYGGRGIRMCKGWDDDYGSFYHDLGPKPHKKMSLDRIDNNGHYSCGHCAECLANGWKMNCKWSTSKEQNRNRRSNVVLNYNGITKSLPEWADEMGVSAKVLWDRLYRFKMPIALALSRK